MTRKSMVELPLLILPTGHRVWASDFNRKTWLRFAVEAAVIFALLLVVIFGATAVDPVGL